MKTNKILVAVVALAIGAAAFQSCKPSSNGKIDGEWTVNLISMTGTATETEVETGVAGTYTDESAFSLNFDGSSYSQNYTYESTDPDGWSYAGEVDNDAAAGAWTETSTYDGVSVSRTGAYSSEAAMTYSFVKDGTYSSTDSHTSQTVETETDPYGTDDFFGVTTTVVTTTDEVSSVTTQGEWSFMGKNKSAELKANERIALSYLSTDELSTTTTTEVTTVVDNTFGLTTTETEVDADTDDVSYTFTSSDVDEIWKITESKKKSLMVEVTADYTSNYSSSNAYTFDGTTTTTSYSGTENETETGTMEMTQQ